MFTMHINVIEIMRVRRWGLGCGSRTFWLCQIRGVSWQLSKSAPKRSRWKRPGLSLQMETDATSRRLPQFKLAWHLWRCAHKAHLCKPGLLERRDAISSDRTCRAVWWAIMSFPISAPSTWTVCSVVLLLKRTKMTLSVSNKGCHKRVVLFQSAGNIRRSSGKVDKCNSE